MLPYQYPARIPAIHLPASQTPPENYLPKHLIRFGTDAIGIEKIP